MSYAALKHDYDTHGFAIVRQFLSGAEFTELRGQLDRYIANVVPTLADQHAFFDDKSRPETLKQMQHMDLDPYFRDYHQNVPCWRDLAETLLGEPVTGAAPEWFNKPPGTNHPTPPHQDNYYFNLAPPNVLTIWLALDPVDEENGCLRYVPGSHKFGFRPHSRSNVLGFSQGISDYGPADYAAEILAPLQPGDAVVHHGDTIHRADPNRSTTRHRRSFAMVWKGMSCQRDEAGFARYQSNLQSQHSQLGLQTTP